MLGLPCCSAMSRGRGTRISTHRQPSRTAGAAAAAKFNAAPFEHKRPALRPLLEHVPRERVVIAAFQACPRCGWDRLCKLGDDITKTLKVLPRQWKIVQAWFQNCTAALSLALREKFSCRGCEKITQPPASFQSRPANALARAPCLYCCSKSSVRMRASASTNVMPVKGAHEPFHPG